jgi:prepilin-type N-terminal cleavage/methylation domain-containing protein
MTFLKTRLSSRKKSGFTVVELLLVLAIIGLLASIVLVSMRNAREKAQVANILQYSATIKHALGYELRAEWKFENNLNDTSGNNNNGILSGSITYENNSVSPELGKAGVLNGSSYANVTNSPTLDVSANNSVTIEGWVKPAGGDTTWYLYYRQSGYYLMFNAGVLRLYLSGVIIPDDGGADNYLNCSPFSFTDGVWKHIVGTYNGSRAAIYVDGEEVCSSDASGATLAGNVINRLGWSFTGSIDEVKIYAAGLVSTEIYQHYVEGARKRGLAVEK